MGNYKVALSPEDRDSNVYADNATYQGHTTNEREQMRRCADALEKTLLRCGCFDVKNMQYGNMYDRVADGNAWPADLYIALHTNGFDGTASGTRVHCYPSAKSRSIGKLIQDRIAPLSPGTGDKLVESTSLYELKATHMPAVLPEFGFHDNPTEAQWLVDNMERIAELTADAVCAYFGVTYVPPVETTEQLGSGAVTREAYDAVVAELEDARTSNSILEATVQAFRERIVNAVDIFDNGNPGTNNDAE